MSTRLKELESKAYVEKEFSKELFAKLVMQDCVKWINDNVGLISPEVKDALAQHMNATIDPCIHIGPDLLFLREDATYNYYRCRNCKEEVKFRIA